MSKALMTRLGLRIKQLREESGQTLSQVAAKTGIRELVLAGLEKGRFNDIDCEQLNTIARAIGVDTMQLVVFPETSPRNAIIDRTRYMSEDELLETRDFIASIAPPPPPRRLILRLRTRAAHLLGRRSITLLRQIRKCRT
jgi:transcriptional regulator with XRE-family HTH domain